MSSPRLPIRYGAHRYTGTPLADALEGIAPSVLVKTCVTCISFTQNGPQEGYCNKWKARPPLKAIVDGCEAYVDIDDDIPF